MFKGLAVKNLKGRPVRTAVLVILTVLLSVTVFAGTVIVQSLRSGLDSLGSRLGADIMVVPREATSKKSFENMILQGSTGYFYMNSSVAEKVERTEGIGDLSEQFFLASTSASCCSVSVQIIGFDPETDFAVTPWIKKSFGRELEKFEVVVGNDLNAFVGDELSFYGTKVTVAAKLERTGTSYDTAVFANEETIKELIRSSIDRGMNDFTDVDPDRAVSCILINTAEGYTPEEVANDINIHNTKVRAVRTQELISGVSDSLGGVSKIVGILIAAVWVLGAVILLLTFTMSSHERRKEFAVLRVVGASRGKLAGIVFREALITCLLGGVVGIAVGLLLLLPFSGLIEQLLSLPYLMPGAGRIVLCALAAVAATAAAGAIAAAISAHRITGQDTGAILRGDN
ncbi:MAG: FtsX-like permease family protein [Ruminococcus sp.]|nr:FtsX-like permease family protein [Ruminococcus sp.]